MRDVGGLTSHLAQEAKTLSTCWRVQRQDGQVFTFTDHDTALVVGDEVYIAAAGFFRSAVQQQAGGQVDNVDVEGLANELGMTEADVRRGLWDYAEIRMFAVNWQSPDSGQIKLRRGWVGEVSATDLGHVQTELRGLANLLTQRVGAYYVPTCRANLGDDKCKVDLVPLTGSGTVSGDPISNTTFDCAGGLNGGDYYTAGVLTWTTGANTGVRREVLEWNGARCILFLPPPYQIVAGDAFTVTPGCLKRLDEDCVAKFSNAINFRGEPFVPGADTLLFVGFHGGDSGGGGKG